jgi:hypothetical protein
MSTILCSSVAACRFFCFCFLFLFYGPGHWTEDVNNTSGFRVERGMFWVWVSLQKFGVVMTVF